MQVTAVGWQVYRVTDSELALGLIGLAQFAPFAVLFLVTGMVADRFSRIRILALCVTTQTVCAALLLFLTFSGETAFGPILGILVIFGVARAFQAPVLQAILPNVVPTKDFPNAVAWTTSGHQIARIGGPTLAGIMIAVFANAGYDEAPVYGVVTVCLLVAAGLTVMVKTMGQKLDKEPPTLTSLLAGLRYIWTRKILFAATGLDLFAVLFGGAMALLPVYAKDILDVGSEGFGVLRSAFMIGAFVGALILTQRPIRRHTGRKLFAVTGLFGVGVMVFGISESFWLSIGALAVMGICDVMSVFIRHNLVQLITPDEMRGRVGAVVGVFVGASNELGEFESGLTAHWWGTVPAVVIGGAATVTVAGLFAILFPALRRVDSLDADALVERYRPAHDRHGRPTGQP